MRTSTTNGVSHDAKPSSSYNIDQLSFEARSLLDRSLACQDAKHGFSTASCQTYDTAWLAMVKNPTDDGHRWAFPESFNWLMRTQDIDGSWGSSKKSQTANIIDTAAALLALVRHVSSPLQINDVAPSDLARRIKSASESLNKQLESCNDIEVTNHIGVEFVLPALLRYLHEELPSSDFSARAPAALARMSEAKNAKFKAEVLYEQKWCPAVYHLEAFVGRIDFDRVADQLFDNGSMWTSPAATAAYLINASVWNDRAEAYIRHVIREGSGHGDGSVPGTFPTNLFEFNWIVATLVHAGYPVYEFDATTRDKVASIVKAQFVEGRGMIGHAPGAIDADDTAKGLLALRLLGKEDGISPDRLISIFEKQDGFSTFGGERDRSISTNCHVLLALLAWKDPAQYKTQIRKAVNFICEYWWAYVGQCKDKWHLSHFYARMLTVESLTSLLHILEQGLISNFLNEDLKTKVSVILTQICVRTLQEQYDDGSWEESNEQTAYAILVLGNVRRLCFLADLDPLIESATELAVTYLGRQTTSTYEQFWTSKTAYGLKFVSEAYHLAARRVALSTDVKPTLGLTLGFASDFADMKDFHRLLKRTKHFRDMQEWLLKASLIESSLWLPMLRTRRLEIFPRDDKRIAKDAYFNLLPALWICCQNRSKNFVPNKFISDMLFMTLINIQVDEFIEGVITPAFEQHPEELHTVIDHTMDQASGRPGSDELVVETTLVEQFRPLALFVEHIIKHQNVARASPRDQKSLEVELRAFLHTQAMQMEDNSKFQQQLSERGQNYHTEIPFFTWVRTTAADHVSTPFTFAWVCCWISAVVGKGTEVFSRPAEKYLAAALALHLAITNRMYNDLGSIARDSAECNLNSVHFPEFAEHKTPEERKQALKNLAEYEQSCVDRTRASLESEVRVGRAEVIDRSYEQAKLHIVGILCDVASLWDQLYTIRDLSSTITTNAA